MGGTFKLLGKIVANCNVDEDGRRMNGVPVKRRAPCPNLS